MRRYYLIDELFIHESTFLTIYVSQNYLTKIVRFFKV